LSDAYQVMDEWCKTAVSPNNGGVPIKISTEIPMWRNW
jgi:hypothetical protein